MRRITIRRMMALIAVLCVVLGVGVNERWRWGYPRRVPYKKSTAIAWMATVIRSDFRMYNGGDVQSLMNNLHASGMFVGKTRDQIVELLGPPDYLFTQAIPRQSLVYTVGRCPRNWLCHPPSLIITFDDHEGCIEVSMLGGD